MFSIVVSRLQKVDPDLGHTIYQAVFLSDSARPASRQNILERLWFTNACKWISQNSLGEFKNTQRHFAISLNPVAKICPKLGMKYGLPINAARQVPFPGAVFPGARA